MDLITVLRVTLKTLKRGLLQLIVLQRLIAIVHVLQTELQMEPADLAVTRLLKKNRFSANRLLILFC
jgi:hypothetical protein